MVKKALVEVFGYDPKDHTDTAQKFWKLSACPFIGKACGKYDHTRTICYGTCSVTNGKEDVIICPNRMYCDDYKAIRRVSNDLFGNIKFMSFEEYIKAYSSYDIEECIVSLGHNSGKEVKIKKMSMDWVLAHIRKGKLIEYVGIEVQSIDITGNYRDAWYAIRDRKEEIPPSQHGLNWANVHKRLIPQIIRKGIVYSKSNLVRNGLQFIVPDVVYQKFEEIIGEDIPLTNKSGKEYITVYTYDLGEFKGFGQKRDMNLNRKITFSVSDFSERFITGPNLPEGSTLDDKIRQILSCS